MSDKPTLLFSVLDALEDALKHCAPRQAQGTSRRSRRLFRGLRGGLLVGARTAIANNAPHANDSERSTDQPAEQALFVSGRKIASLQATQRGAVCHCAEISQLWARYDGGIPQVAR
jgi:hypothetical protein